MQNLYEDPDKKLEEPLIANESRIINKTIMKTPCNHRFHIICLLEWTKIKLDCPICRKKLPPME